MKRRQFIFQSMLLGAGFSVLPKGMVLGSPSVLPTQINLGKALEHVRHGQFSTEAIRHPKLPDWLELYRPHTLYANGFQSGTQDLHHWAFKLNNEIVHLNAQGELVHVLNKQTTKTISLAQNSAEELRFINDVQLSLCRFNEMNNCVVSPRHSESVVIVLKGNGTINDRTITTQTALVYRERAELKIHPENEMLLLFLG
jgi:SpoU rRNA methylase family enzyme